MANEEQLARLKHWVGDQADRRGVEAWNQWRAVHRDIRPALSGADLSGLAHLFRADSPGRISPGRSSRMLISYGRISASKFKAL
jgi:hypothetical protein